MIQTVAEGLSVKGVSKRIGSVTILNTMSLTVHPGRITGLIGQNGAGKSTLFKILMGLIRADSGSASINGLDILSAPLHRKAELGIGYLPQASASFPGLTVRENLQALLEILPLYRKDWKNRLEYLLDITGLEPIAERAFKWLSGGEQRRLEIAKALIMQPRIVLMDEPFSGLDPGIVEGVIEVIKRLASSGVGILLTDHNIHMTLPIVDYAYLMASGGIVCGGSPEEITGNDLARKLYLGEQFSVQS